MSASACVFGPARGSYRADCGSGSPALLFLRLAIRYLEVHTRTEGALLPKDTVLLRIRS